MSHLLIVGAGAVGAIMAVRALDAGHSVTLLTRPGDAEATRERGLTVTGWGSGPRVLVGAGSQGRAGLSDDPKVAAQADFVGIAVPAHETEAVAMQLAPHLRPGVPVASWQNGVDNVRWLRGVLGTERPVLGSVVIFNAVTVRPGVVAYAMPAPVVYGAQDALHLPAGLDQDHPTVDQRVRFARDLIAVQWSKLLTNLVNGPLTLTPLGFKAALQDPDVRACGRLVLQEGLRIVRAAEIEPETIPGVDPRKILLLLRIPRVFNALVAHLLPALSDEARPSTAQMLGRTGRTEVPHLNGRIVRLAEEHGLVAPVNARVAALVRVEEARPAQERGLWRPVDVLAQLRAARA